MTPLTSESSTQRASRARAEAAVWIVWLHGPGRDAALEAGLRRWLAEDPAHAKAYELATAVWNDSGPLTGKLPRGPVPRPILAAVAACLVLIAVGIIAYVRMSGVATRVGEQRTLHLDDGTEVVLNTSTRLVVRYNGHTRQVILKSGEAYFNVTRHERRPFVVVTSDREVVATGTTFVVRREDNSDTELTVTLIEGRVAVKPVGVANVLPPNNPAPRETVLQAGERAIFSRSGPPTVDTPPVKKVLSWMEGKLTFESLPLREAIVEINRYSTLQITLASPEVGSILVGGVFRTGDSLSFAHTVADAYHLRLVKRADRLVLEPLQPEKSTKERAPSN